MAKRGRPRTQRNEHDYGTPEAIARRQALIGSRRQGWPEPDLAAAESALGVLLWQGYLHPHYETARRLHDAGVQFAGWWILKYPKTLTGTLGRLQPGNSGGAIDTTEAERLLAAAAAHLGRERQVLDAVINTAVYQRINLRHIAKLRVGLSQLVTLQRARNAPPLAVVRDIRHSAPSLAWVAS